MSGATQTLAQLRAAWDRARCHVGPGDEGEPVVTIMRPDES